MRITQNMLGRTMLSNINRAYERMAGLDISRRITRPSDDPGGAQRMIGLQGLLGRNTRFQGNVGIAQRWLAAADQSLSDLGECYRSASEIALSAGDIAADTEGMLSSLDAIIERVLSNANSKLGDSYLFSGGRLSTLPFERASGQVIYHGDDSSLATSISDGLSLQYNLPGSELFADHPAWTEGSIDWDPALGWDTPFHEFFDGQGFESGSIRISDGEGNSMVLDCTELETLADFRDAVQAEMPDLQFSIADQRRLEISGNSSLEIEDLQGGSTARVLGIDGYHDDGFLSSRDLDPRMGLGSSLNTMMGIDLSLGTIQIQLEGESAAREVNLSGAETVRDLVQRIGEEVPEMQIRISESGNRLHFETVGGQGFEISSLEDDSTAMLLGIEGKGIPSRPFELLFELREAIASGDTEALQPLIAELELVESRMIRERGRVGSRLDLAEDALLTLQSRELSYTETLSELGDADLAETLMLYQNAEASYQASLMLASSIYQMTLASYL
ncbi:MAG: hypothetical protein QF492_03865 [Candidatus Krumholzibacteria bacterium]|nr:hypothetical protein [Candidatus Krumholzibacteria bacterium]MDP6797686.1 hypothetical protein [Candidatus Krumholzibacteria bacterium]MDP7020973.1 hypothetical protein [Candidatus Krumholzibacteria bacterium]